MNPIGPRCVYDEAKRFAEAATMAYHRVHGLPVRIIRIFNTYGPRMRRTTGAPCRIHRSGAHRPTDHGHGDGSQTRSLCYVDDLIEGIWRVLQADLTGPINLGSTEEVSVLHLAELIRSLANSPSELVFEERPVDDPEVRRPDTTLARELLGWQPVVSLHDGLQKTLDALRDAPEVRGVDAGTMMKRSAGTATGAPRWWPRRRASRLI